jgi:prepilin-type N-terminal cleavage/methylation domain-containing protein
MYFLFEYMYNKCIRNLGGTMQKNKNMSTGFTIVELLIVIIVIAILAAIVIAAYNGVQNRAKASSAQFAAASVIKKVELFNIEKASYPAISTDLTGATASGMSYYLTGVSFVAAMGTTAPASPQSASFYKCGTGAATAAPTTVAGITTITGTRIDYFNYTSSTTASASAGITSGAISTYNVGCVINN